MKCSCSLKEITHNQLMICFVNGLDYCLWQCVSTINNWVVVIVVCLDCVALLYR